MVDAVIWDLMHWTPDNREAVSGEADWEWRRKLLDLRPIDMSDALVDKT